MSIGDRIRQRRKELGIPSQAALAHLCGWDNGARVSNYENNIRTPKPWDAVKLGKALHLSPDYILFEPEDLPDRQPKNNLFPPIQTKGVIPLLTWEQLLKSNSGDDMNQLMESTEEKKYIAIDDAVAGESISAKCFALPVRGDSMVATHSTPSNRPFFDGDTLIIDPNKDPSNGKYVIAIVNNSTLLFRKYVVESDGVYLKATNIQDKSIKLDDSIRIVGVLVESRVSH